MVPRIFSRQIGHLVSSGAQELQHTRCPHFRKTILAVLSRHTLHTKVSLQDSNMPVGSGTVKKKKKTGCYNNSVPSFQRNTIYLLILNYRTPVIL